MSHDLKINPQLDLVFERVSSVPVEKIWQGWTHPETLMQWFCPKPWKVTACQIELHPGGEFFTLMQGPEGQQMANHGCYLEVKENEKLVWTNMMTKDFRPTPENSLGFSFVATILLSKTDNGSLYKAIVTHADEGSRKKHDQIGFQEGWGIAFEQLAALGKYEKPK